MWVMNILLISPYFSPAVGGVETHLSDLCRYFTTRKHNVYVRTYQALGSTIKGRVTEDTRFIKIHRQSWPDFNLIFKLERYPTLKFIYLFSGIFLDSLLFLLKTSKDIDVIQVHGFIAALAGVVLGKIYKKRVVVNTHVGFKLNNGLMTRIIKWTLSRADKVLVLTKSAKESLIKIGIPEDKIIIYHYWVNQKKFTSKPSGNKFLGKEFVVLFVGRLVKVKGVEIIFELAKALKSIKFIIVGTGPLSEELLDKTSAFSNVKFLGKVENRDLPNFYNSANLLLIPSKLIKQEYEEGIPRVMIEALSCGLPVVATPAGGIPDVFSEKIGRLVNDTSSSIVKTLKYLYINSDKLKSMAKNCRMYALKNFSIRNAKIIEESLLQSSHE